MQTVFVNPERCIGCLQCELACAVEHSSGRDAATSSSPSTLDSNDSGLENSGSRNSEALA